MQLFCRKCGEEITLTQDDFEKVVTICLDKNYEWSIEDVVNEILECRCEKPHCEIRFIPAASHPRKLMQKEQEKLSSLYAIACI